MLMQSGYRLGLLVLGSLLIVAAPSAGQDPLHPPIEGLTGVIGLTWNIDKFYSDVNKTLEKIGDGVDSGARRTPSKVDADGVLERMRPGTAVAVGYMVNGIQASADEARLNEGIITSVDRRKDEITIRYADGDTDSLRLTQHPSHKGRVIVYYPDASGQKIPYYFKPAS
jgi:hypothetical protein